MLRFVIVRLLSAVVALAGILALALLLRGESGREAPLIPRPEPACVAVPLESPCDPAPTRVEVASGPRHELDPGSSDSRQTLAEEHGSYAFVPAALIVATVRDESGHPVHDALVRGLRDAPDSRPITASASDGTIRLVGEHATARVVISAPGFRSRRFENVADTDVLTLQRGVGIGLQVPLSAAKVPPQRLHVILTPKGTVPWFRKRGTRDRWSGVEHDDGELMQLAPEFMRVFGNGEITGEFDETGTARVVVSDPGDYEVCLVLGTVTHVTMGYDMHGATDVEALHAITPDPMPHITVDARDEGRLFSIPL